jgi:hypothetical protein
MVVELFIAILVNKAFGVLGEGGAEEHTKAGAMLAYLFTDCALGAGGHVAD